jgi:hypothetical protein
MIVTKDFILDNKTAAGGWTFSQLAILGAGWPPKKGWMDRVVGAELPDDAAQKFVELGAAGKQTKKARRQIKREAANLARQIKFADKSKGAKPGRTYIYCPYEEKDEAKSMGAKWDKERRMWFVPDGLSISEFKRWLNPQTKAKSACEDPPELIRLVRDIGYQS